MLADISSREWSEWRAFWQLYGFGERRMDVRFARLMALIVNLVPGDGRQPASPADFLPDEDEDEYDGEYGEADGDEQAVLDEDQLIFEAIVAEAMG